MILNGNYKNHRRLLAYGGFHTKHHLNYRNLFGIFRTVLHTASSQGDSLAVGQYSYSTKSARKSFTDFKWCLVLVLIKHYKISFGDLLYLLIIFNTEYLY